MAIVSLINGGIEIDRGDRDLSAITRDSQIDLGIGDDYQAFGYKQYLDFQLTKQEAIAFRNWLNEAIDRI